MTKKQKVFLLSLDGWGIAPPSDGNAIENAHTPNMDKLRGKSDYYAELKASGLDVGLPKGVMGNSEVGHMTMGSGRQMLTDIVRINMSIENKTIYKNKTLIEAFEKSKQNSNRLHFLGLLSDGSVHSHINHLYELIKCAKQNDVKEVYIHAFLDGRDTPPTSGVSYMTNLINFIKNQKYAKIATVIGRYYAMDRDERWDRIKLAYNMLVKGEGTMVDETDIINNLKNNYEKNTTDEFMKPLILLPDNEGCIKNDDVLIFYNFRSDRMRQIVKTFGISPQFSVDTNVKNLHVVQMTQYNKSFNLPVIFPVDSINNVLSEWISKNNLKQFHTAETEKYAHVTFFFNGGTEKAFKNEDRKMIDSPSVKTYDLKPDMSMFEVANEVIKSMKKDKYNFIVCNFAPPDMVGHTGNYEATVTACTKTDEIIGKLIEQSEEYNYIMIVTSDHGNAEEMIDSFGNPKTSHNTNLVPFCLIPINKNSDEYKLKIKEGSLQDVAPTICKILKIDVPEEMSGKSLL